MCQYMLGYNLQRGIGEAREEKEKKREQQEGGREKKRMMHPLEIVQTIRNLCERSRK